MKVNVQQIESRFLPDYDALYYFVAWEKHKDSDP